MLVLEPIRPLFMTLLDLPRYALLRPEPPHPASPRVTQSDLTQPDPSRPDPTCTI